MHDIYRNSENDNQAVKDIIKAEVLIVISQKDHLVNPENSIAFSEFINCQLLELNGDCGHIAPWCETQKIKDVLVTFLE